MNKFDYLSTDDIDQVIIDVMASWHEIICNGSQLATIDADIEYDQLESNSSGYYNAATGFLEPLMDEIEILKELLIKVEYSCFSKNLQIIILCKIIQDRLPFNYVRRVVVKKVLNNAILNEGNQCHHRSEQLLLYVRVEKGIGKSRVIKTIQLGFCNYLVTWPGHLT